MKTCSDVVRSGELAASFESLNDLVAVRKIGYIIAAFTVTFDRTNLAVDAEAADSVVGTELQRCLQRIGVCQTKPRQFCEGRLTIHAADGLDRGVAELDRLLQEDAAKAEAS